MAHAIRDVTEAAAQGAGELRSVVTLWREAVGEGRESPAYLVERGGEWEPVAWAEAGRAVDELALGFLDRGVRRGDKLAILARSTLEWALLDYALLSIGAVVVPIFPMSSPSECSYILEHSDAVGIVVEDDGQLAKIDSVRSALPKLVHVLTFADLEELRRRGRDLGEARPETLDAARGAVLAGDTATLIYTSGTTGPPKGCVLTHATTWAMTRITEHVGGLVRGHVALLYLPLAHSFGRIVHFGAAHRGVTVAFCPDIQRLAEAMQQVRPHFLPSVPRVFEKVHAAVIGQRDEATGLKRRLMDWALQVGRDTSARREAGRRVPPALALQHRVADALVYRKVKAKLGGRLRFALSSGAPLAPEIARFFHSLDLLVLEAYGMTECLPVAVNQPDCFRFGTVGPPLPGCDVRVDAGDEVVIRADHVFAGYFKDDEATRAAFTDDGWLRTGDVGELDADGFLRIVDRKKDLIISAYGKNVSPQNIENDLKSSRYISQALAVGDGRPFIAALVTLDEDEIGKWARERSLEADVGALAHHDEVHALVQDVVDEVNRTRDHASQVKKFAILPRDFSADRGEVTQTLKLKRRVCEQHFADVIEGLYRPDR